MSAIDLRRLVGRLDETCRKSLEAAAGNTLSRSHYNVELEHWLLQLLDMSRSDVVLAVERAGIVPARLAGELTAALARMATGNGRAPSLAPELVGVLKEAWVFASVERGEASLRSGHLLCAILADETVAQRLFLVAPSLRRIGAEALRRDFDKIFDGGSETAARETAAVPGQAAAPGAMEALERFTIDLTARARAGAIDKLFGRDTEIRQLVDILTRRRQNNPILTGEAGVGKTAIVEGLALRIAAGDVPPLLASVAIRTLDLGLLQAGAGIRGEFENRLRAVIDGVRASPVPVVLFVDEAHMLVGAGGAEGQGDAANLLKPALARGELRMIAATTWAEYKKFFERDAALTRRFQPVKVEEPPEPVAIDMVRGLLPALEAHHGVRVLDEAVAAAVRLSARFLPGRQLPDKAVSLIDTACARVAMSQAATPAAIEGDTRRLAAIATETALLHREALADGAHADRLAALEREQAGLDDRLAGLRVRWQEERALAAEAAALRAALEAAPTDPARRDALRATLALLEAVQGARPMVFPVVDAQAVAEIVESWTGIPAGRMQQDEIRTVLGLREALGRRVIGQDHALEAVAQAIRTARAGLTDPRKPVGVFLMVGTSGVGKTETALALAELLYGGEQNLTTINMSEFKEEHKVSLLMGAPPGYVGYGEGGVLTEAVRRRPHSVILLDEIEKAHPGVQDVFFQVFDKGTMKDGEGRDVDFRNSVVIMTSNAGTETIAALFADPATAPDPDGLAQALRADLAKQFRPAFLGRVTVVPYVPLDAPVLRRIVGLQLERVLRRVRERFGTEVTFADGLVDALQERCTDPGVGARGIETLLARGLLPELAAHFLGRMAGGEAIGPVAVAEDGAGGFEVRAR
ncbi:AAA+ ATPase ClpV1 [Rhodovastum atsumiense]|uniref:Type VI secretion system ATPase TssH n=1 Tax=Rhodovastum atsumiense TaxID=504468 RepID=A0A5M6IZB7_9PROT|nr:type VI secretion system ATPase TssH [Rhodovastum atsumiense]KAA5612725.1 type VI secretion system ATPase TssH [Rhodovastum atsumiense]CAH2602719.1 AAA+ ATPase ClpV1 [Rhodovastum atsumiense]